MVWIKGCAEIISSCGVPFISMLAVRPEKPQENPAIVEQCQDKIVDAFLDGASAPDKEQLHYFQEPSKVGRKVRLGHKSECFKLIESLD